MTACKGFRFLVAFLLLSLLLPALAVRPARAQEGEGKLIRVGFSDLSGIIEADGKGGYAGYGCAYLAEIAKHTGWRYEYVYGTWEECMERLKRGQVDLLCEMHYLGRRAQQYDFSKYACGMEYGAMFVRDDRQDVYYEDFASFNGMSIGFVSGSGYNELFEQYARAHGFAFLALYYPDFASLDAALARGDVDAAVGGGLRRLAGEKVVSRFSPDPFYFTVRKGNNAVLYPLNEALEEINLGNIHFSAQLMEAYFATAQENTAFTRQEAAFIAAHPTLRMAYDPQWFPMEYEQEGTGEFSGVSAELMRLISKDCGIAFQFVHTGDYDESLTLLREGRVDLLCGLIEREDMAGESNARLTDPYIQLPVVMAKRGGARFSGRTIGLAQNYVGVRRFLTEEYPGARITLYGSTGEALQALLDGRVSVAVDNAYALDQLLKLPRYQALEMVSASRAAFPMCIAVSEKLPPVALSVLNKSIARLGEGKKNEVLLRNTTAAYPQMDTAQVLRHYRVFLVGVVCLVGCLILAIIVYFAYRSRKILKKYAFTDLLTGERNWNRFCLDAKERLRAGPPPGEKYAVIEFDINKFKLINDMQGYGAGDSILQHVSATLSRDLDKNELFCRQYADNFVALLHFGSPEALRARMDRLGARVCAAPVAQGKFQYAISCGVYPLEGVGEDIQTAVDRANLARRSLPPGQRGGVALYSQEMRSAILYEKEIENRMEAALENHEFVVYYQPKFELFTGKVVGAEALVRWRWENGTILSPDKFIPLFEMNGFICKLDLYVFEEVCRQLKEWIGRGIYPYPVSVNLSRVQLGRRDFYETYLEIMHRYEVPSYLIELELTENAVADNQEEVVSMMHTLRSKGFLLAMDDFGSGYSSLNMLKDLPIDSLKIDREFFNSSSDNERGQKIISNIVSLAKELYILVISEGVETAQQVAFLKDIGCTAAQGFYFSKPLPVAEFEKVAFCRQAGVATA